MFGLLSDVYVSDYTHVCVCFFVYLVCVEWRTLTESIVFDAYTDLCFNWTLEIHLKDGSEDECMEDDSTNACLCTSANQTLLPRIPSKYSYFLDARSVLPQCGNVLVFPHGESAGSLVHEGAAVTGGVKFIIRTDVLYKLPGKEDKAQSSPQNR